MSVTFLVCKWGVTRCLRMAVMSSETPAASSLRGALWLVGPCWLVGLWSVGFIEEKTSRQDVFEKLPTWSLGFGCGQE